METTEINDTNELNQDIKLRAAIEKSVAGHRKIITRTEVVDLEIAELARKIDDLENETRIFDRTLTPKDAQLQLYYHQSKMLESNIENLTHAYSSTLLRTRALEQQLEGTTVEIEQKMKSMVQQRNRAKRAIFEAEKQRIARPWVSESQELKQTVKLMEEQLEERRRYVQKLTEDIEQCRHMVDEEQRLPFEQLAVFISSTMLKYRNLRSRFCTTRAKVWRLEVQSQSDDEDESEEGHDAEMDKMLVDRSAKPSREKLAEPAVEKSVEPGVETPLSVCPSVQISVSRSEVGISCDDEIGMSSSVSQQLITTDDNNGSFALLSDEGNRTESRLNCSISNSNDKSWDFLNKSDNLLDKSTDDPTSKSSNNFLAMFGIDSTQNDESIDNRPFSFAMTASPDKTGHSPSTALNIFGF